MSQLDVARLLSSLREHGTIDSQGEFTISLSEARRKLTEFRSSNRRRYLLLMVSAGIGSGAGSVTVKREGGSYCLAMPGAYLPESELLGSFSRSTSDSERSTDLVLGLQSAFAEGAQEVRILLSHPDQGSYQWTLQPDSESSEPRPAGPAEVRVEIRFPRDLGQRIRGLLGRFGGYAGQPEELRLIEQMCDHSPVPIVLEATPIARPFFFPPQTWVAAIGEVAGRTNWQLPARSWRGLLGLGDGPVWVVVRGVTMGQVEGTGLQGLVYHDGLKLDLTREKLVTEQTYAQLLRELEETRLTLLEHWAQAMVTSIAEPRFDPLLNPALAAALGGRFRARTTAELANWLSGSQRRHADNAELREHLVEAAEAARQRPAFAQLISVDGPLLEECARTLKARKDDTPALFQLTLEVLQRSQPEESLMRGYLLLGLGAFHSAAGREPLAQRTWMQALDVVRAGQDDQAETLIHAHMDFQVDHIMDQVGNAILMFLRDSSVFLGRST